MSSTAELVGRINDAIINPILLLLFVVGLALFVWGVAEFIRNADSPEERRNGQRHIIWGIAGMFLMFAVFGILRVLLNTFGIPLPDAL
jgi:uncharacterized membrane protein YidH (DUF202 family)